MSEIKFGKVEVTVPKQAARRMAILLWGPSGSGKTTLAATSPGKKLWINFDDGGTDCIASRDDILQVDLSSSPDNVVMGFRKAEAGMCRDLKKILEDDESIETVVFDSLTTYGDKALQHGVIEAQGTAKGRSSTIEDPGFAGYGNKNTWTNLLVKNILQITGQFNRHVIFIAHEDKPEKDDKGIVLHISIMLGSSLNEQLPVKLSEIWNLHDTGRERRIAVRACRARKPMKSRMFITSGEPEFIWDYNADTDEGSGIADWYAEWVKANGSKIKLPSDG